MIASATWTLVVAWLAPAGDKGAIVPDNLDELVFARSDLWPALLVLPLLVALWGYGAYRRRKTLRALGKLRLVAHLVASVNRRNRALRSVSTVVAAGLVALALMRPQYGGTAEVVPASGVDVVLAVDYSKSMLARDVYPSRSERLAAELSRFLDAARERGDRVGLVVFAGEARGLPLTRDSRLLQLYLQRADPRTENPGGTAIGKALRLALTFLVDARREDAAALDEEPDAADARDIPPPATEQIIVLLTDGEDNASRPREVAAEAARLGVRIFTVGIGSPSGEPIQKFDEEGNPAGYVTDDSGNYVLTRLDEGLLKDLAKATGGRYIKIDSEHFGLDEVRAALAEATTEARRDHIEIHREEGFAYLVGPALLLLCVGLALPSRNRRSRP